MNDVSEPRIGLVRRVYHRVLDMFFQRRFDDPFPSEP